ncbi:MAG: hypothetical protein R2827_09400 [Bdellovibrionales bacterium]
MSGLEITFPEEDLQLSNINELEERVVIPSLLANTESRQRLARVFDREVDADLRNNISKVLGSAETVESNYLKNATKLVQNAEYSLALKLIRECLNINPKNGRAIKLLGQCFLGEGKVDQAIQCFKSLISIETSFDSLNMLARAYYQNNDDESALEFYMKALEVQVFDDPTLFEIYKNIGNIYGAVR